MGAADARMCLVKGGCAFSGEVAVHVMEPDGAGKMEVA